MKKSAVLYIHGNGGSAEEAAHYRSLFEYCDVIGLDYRAQTPWEAKEEFPRLFDSLCGQYDAVTVIANSIGAYFAMQALPTKKIESVFFISPVVNMPKLIEDMMMWAGVSEAELRDKGEIETAFGQTLSWEYLSYAREHPARWPVPTRILYGSRDEMTSFAMISTFAGQIGATLTVMENGEHWFHTKAQMQFLDRWIESALREETEESEGVR